MATIALYANKLNTMPGLVSDIRSSANDFKSELMSLKGKVQSINRNICNVDDVLTSISASTKMQEDKIDVLNRLGEEVKRFAADVAKVDGNVAQKVEQSKKDFYDKYSYLKPFWEKNLFEQMLDVGSFLLKSAAEWCIEHWKEITTVILILGAIAAVALVIATGGMALAPMLAAILTSLGMASGTALTVATITSLVVAGIALTSTVASTTLNIIDIWCDMSENSTFQFWKNVMNLTSAISNLLYAPGTVYNAFHGIEKSALKQYGMNYLMKSDFRNNISNAAKYNFTIQRNTSVFYKDMEDVGEHVAKRYVKRFGGETPETLLEKNYVNRRIPNIINSEDASAAMALRSTGKVKVILGPISESKSIWTKTPWKDIEGILVKINPKVTGIIETGGVGTIKTYIPRKISYKEIGKSIVGVLGKIGSGVNKVWGNDNK